MRTAGVRRGERRRRRARAVPRGVLQVRGLRRAVRDRDVREDRGGDLLPTLRARASDSAPPTRRRRAGDRDVREATDDGDERERERCVRGDGDDDEREGERASEGTARATAALTRSACERCGKAAYPIESVDVDGKKWHRAGCFKCAKCGTALSLATFVKFDGELYCRRDAPRRAPAFERESSSAGIEIEIDGASVKAMSVADEIVVEKAAAVEERAAAEIAATADEIEIEASENEPPAAARDAKDAFESLEPATNADVEAITENIAATKIADDSATIPKPQPSPADAAAARRRIRKKVEVASDSCANLAPLEYYKPCRCKASVCASEGVMMRRAPRTNLYPLIPFVCASRVL